MTVPRQMVYASNAVTLDQVQAAGGYGVIYADVAWNYRDKVRVTLDEAQYPTMDLADVKALPVVRLAAKDCALFMWGTWPQLPAVLETIAVWGFEYKTLAFVWVKRNAKAGSLFWGNGSWTRANTEPCFLAVRGKPKRVDKGVHQVIEDFVPEDVLDAELVRGEHSSKPAVVRERIRLLMGDVPSIELFARDRDPAWGNVWGLDAPGGSDVVLEAPPRVLPAGLAVTLFDHPLWPALRPFAHLMPKEHHRLDFLNLPDDLRAQALAIESLCVSCGAKVHPLRARAKSGRSRIAGTEVEHRLFYAASCAQEVNPGCTRTKKAQEHVRWVREMLILDGAEVGP